MKNFEDNYYNPPFSHIYVERKIRENPRTLRILEKFPQSVVVEINHYKDIFCRGGQNAVLQHHSQKLVLAAKEGELVYRGAPVCQNFGNEHFYYVSCAMNCIYDCEYCYLKGMYPSGNLVMFLNMEDIFAQTDRLLMQHPLYLCVSYDTDLLALSGIFPYVSEWVSFAKTRPELKLEIRTKSANVAAIANQPPLPNVIYAFTMSPQEICERYEKKAPEFTARAECASKAVALGHPVRLCFDPMIYCRDWKKQYGNMVAELAARLDFSRLLDVSVGSFRISKDYLKKMRKIQPESSVVQFPFVNENGYYQYPNEIMREMERYLVERLREYLPEEKIFMWKEE